MKINNISYRKLSLIKKKIQNKKRTRSNKISNKHNGETRMCVHWYFAEHFSDLSYRVFPKYKGRILDELGVSFNVKKTEFVILRKMKIDA